MRESVLYIDIFMRYAKITPNMEQGSQSPQEQGRKDYLLPASILIAGVMISGSIFYLVGNQNQNRAGLGLAREQLDPESGQALQSPKISSRDVILGDLNAKVALIEYGDYQCPFCGRFFSDTESLIRENYIKSGKVKMVYRNFAFLGPESFAAAEAAECARDQKQFWAYHDLLFTTEIQDGSEHNGNLNRDLFMKLAGQLKLDTNAFGACVDNKKYADLIKKDASDAKAVGVNSTPIIFINDQKIQGALPYDNFKSVIDNFLL